MAPTKRQKGALHQVGAANDVFVAETQQIAKDAGVEISRDDVVEMQLRAGEQHRPFGKVFREFLEARIRPA